MAHLRALLVCLLFAPLLPADELNTLKGKKLTGQLVSADGQAIVIKTEAGEVATPLPEALQLTLSTTPAKMPDKYLDVELIDGSLFHCTSFSFKGKTLVVNVLPGITRSIPMEKVAYILNDAQDPNTRNEWDKIFADRGRSDRFFIRNNNQLDGKAGTFGEANAAGTTITFETTDGTRRDLPLAQLVALLFNNRLEGNIPPTMCKVIDANQNMVIANKATLKDGKLTLVTVSQVTIEYPTLTTVAMMDYSRDKVVYLSDMKLSEENVFDESLVTYNRDKNLDNQAITLEGVPYAKGLVIHAGMVLKTDLAAEYKEFKAILGFDPNCAPVSDVKVIFEGDGRQLYTAEVRAKEPHPQPITLDVKKVRSLKISVVASEGLFIGRQVTLADAKVSK
jgi:hypothetical protein